MSSNKLFDHLSNLTKLKTPWDDSPEFINDYNVFMINRFIGMTDDFLPLIEKLNGMQYLPVEFHYKCLLNFLPKKFIRFNYIGKMKDKNSFLKLICDYYEVNLLDAIEIEELMPDEVRKHIENTYDDASIKKNRK